MRVGPEPPRIPGASLGGLGAGAGFALAGLGAGAPRWLGGRPYAALDFQACLSTLTSGLSSAQRARTVLPWDHPTRQVTNTVAIVKDPHVGTLFDADQIDLIHRLYETMVSQQGRDWLRNTITLEGRLEGCVLAVYQDGDGRRQAMISGGHLLLRAGSDAGD